MEKRGRGGREGKAGKGTAKPPHPFGVDE